jgi:NAD(P)-dependent dehydrogenase (short-subunit alcohol dehydrogenase family)
MPRFTGKVPLVTGAASGIGAAIAILLASDGAFVWCADLDPIAVERVVGFGLSAKALRLDAADNRDWVDGMARVTAESGKLDILVNAAGISNPKSMSSRQVSCPFRNFRQHGVGLISVRRVAAILEPVQLDVWCRA